MLLPAVERLLAAGDLVRAEEAVALRFEQALQNARRSGTLDAKLSATIATTAVHLATKLKKPQWIEFVFDLYAAGELLLPAEVVDEFHRAIRVAPRFEIERLRRYLEISRKRAKNAGPAAQFVVRRLEGLEKIAASR